MPSIARRTVVQGAALGTALAAFASTEATALIVRSDRALHVTVNGHEAGYFTPDALAAGIPTR